jgi:hypothetical protein
MPETVFTISGPSVEYGDPMMYGPGDPPTLDEKDLACAMHVKPLVVTSVIAGMAGIGTGLFGVYKAGQRRTGVSLLSFATTVGLWWFGGKLMRSAMVGFQACQGSGVGP